MMQVRELGAEYIATVRLFYVNSTNGKLHEAPRFQGSYGADDLSPASIYGLSADGKIRRPPVHRRARATGVQTQGGVFRLPEILRSSSMTSMSSQPSARARSARPYWRRLPSRLYFTRGKSRRHDATRSAPEVAQSKSWLSLRASFANSTPFVHPTSFNSRRAWGGRYWWIDIR